MVHRIDSLGNQGGQWVGGSPFAGIRGTIIAADWLNAFQEELVGLVEAEGLSPTKADVSQIRQAILIIAARLAGSELYFTAGAALTAGDPLLSGDAFGVIKDSVAMGETATLQVRGTFPLPKDTADDIALHAHVYWDDGAGEVTLTAGGNRSIGVAAVAAGVGITTIQVALSGPPSL